MSKSNNKGKVIVLTAPSGSGKTSVGRFLLREIEQLRFSVSATTRAPRSDEVDGKDYYFLSTKEFNRLVKENAFLEWEEFYQGTRYGTLKSEVDKQLDSGYFVLLDIDVKGALNVKNIYEDKCLSIFLRPPSLDELERRLAKRGTESDETLDLRLKRAREEIKFEGNFDRTVINENLDKTCKEVKNIVEDFISGF